MVGAEYCWWRSDWLKRWSDWQPSALFTSALVSGRRRILLMTFWLAETLEWLTAQCSVYVCFSQWSAQNIADDVLIGWSAGVTDSLARCVHLLLSVHDHVVTVCCHWACMSWVASWQEAGAAVCVSCILSYSQPSSSCFYRPVHTHHHHWRCHHCHCSHAHHRYIFLYSSSSSSSSSPQAHFPTLIVNIITITILATLTAGTFFSTHHQHRHHHHHRYNCSHVHHRHTSPTLIINIITITIVATLTAGTFFSAHHQHRHHHHHRYHCSHAYHRHIFPHSSSSPPSLSPSSHHWSHAHHRHIFPHSSSSPPSLSPSSHHWSHAHHRHIFPSFLPSQSQLNEFCFLAVADLFGPQLKLLPWHASYLVTLPPRCCSLLLVWAQRVNSLVSQCLLCFSVWYLSFGCAFIPAAVCLFQYGHICVFVCVFFTVLSIDWR